MQDKILLRAQELYGYKNQVSVVSEECCELAKECNKYVRYPNHDVAAIHMRDKILEELADVQICLRHLELMFGFTEEEVNMNIELKLARLGRWLEAEDKTMYQTTVDRRIGNESQDI